MSARREPYVIDEKAGTKAICACGLSANQPYCNGSHRTVGKQPLIVQLDGDKKVAWCGCRQSKNFPYCDGTHATLK